MTLWAYGAELIGSCFLYQHSMYTLEQCPFTSGKFSSSMKTEVLCFIMGNSQIVYAIPDE